MKCGYKWSGKDIFEIIDEHKSQIDDYFWKYYENVTTKKMEDYIRDVLDYVNISGKVLSISCGHGLNEIVMADMCDDIESILGVDIVEFKIKSMNQIVDILSCENVEGIVGDVMKLNFLDGSFDCILIIESLSHVDDQLLALKEAARVLKVGGYIFVMDFNNGANPRIPYLCWKGRIFKGIMENPVNPYFVKNRLRGFGIQDLTIKPYRNTRLFVKLGDDLFFEKLNLPDWMHLILAKGFMLKGKKY